MVFAMRLSNYGPWIPVSEFLAHIGGPEKMQKAIEEKRAQFVTVSGAGGVSHLCRYIEPSTSSLKPGVWLTKRQAAERLGVSKKCIEQRMARSELGYKIDAGQILVCLLEGVHTEDRSQETIVSLPDLL